MWIHREARPGAGLLQRNFDTAEIRSELHPRLGSLQGDPHAFFVYQVNAAGAADKGAASADAEVGAGKITHLPYACSPSFQPCDRCTR